MFQCKVLKPCCCSCREEEAGSADWLCLLLNRVNWSPQKNPLGTRTVTQTTCHSAHSPVPPACVRMSDKHGQNPPEWAGRQLTFLVTIVLVPSTTSKKRWVPWKESTSKQEFQKAGDKGRTALWYICRLLLYQHMWWVMKEGRRGGARHRQLSTQVMCFSLTECLLSEFCTDKLEHELDEMKRNTHTQKPCEMFWMNPFLPDGWAYTQREGKKKLLILQSFDVTHLASWVKPKMSDFENQAQARER